MIINIIIITKIINANIIIIISKLIKINIIKNI